MRRTTPRPRRSTSRSDPMFAVLLFVLAAATADAVPSDSAPANQQAEHRAEVSRVAGEKVRRLKVTAGDDQPIAAELRRESLLRWSNPTVAEVYGEVFVWTSGGRPVALGSVYHAYDRPWGWTLELVSLSKSRVRASEGQQPIWDAEQGGIVLRPFPDAPPPAQKAATRLSQMRKLVERFSIELEDGRTNDEIHRRLRVLPQPLYRYSSDKENIVDGALYAVAEATDPEVWILLEAAGPAGSSSWRYAVARMNMWPMQIRLDGKIVQTWEKIARPYGNRKAAYTLCPFSPGAASRPPADE